MELQAIRTIDDLGRINLPRALREKLGWQIGMAVELLHVNDTIVLKPADLNPISGACHKPGLKAHKDDCDLCKMCGRS